MADPQAELPSACAQDAHAALVTVVTRVRLFPSRYLVQLVFDQTVVIGPYSIANIAERVEQPFLPYNCQSVKSRDQKE